MCLCRSPSALSIGVSLIGMKPIRNLYVEVRLFVDVGWRLKIFNLSL